DLLRRYAADLADAEDGPAERRAARGRLFDRYQTAVDAAAKLIYSEVARLPEPVTSRAAKPARRADPPIFTDSVTALAWLDAERENLVAAATQAAEQGPRPVAWRLADALRGYFHLRMHTVDWLAVAGAGLTAAQLDGDLAAQAALRL